MKDEKLTGIALAAALMLLAVWVVSLIWMGLHRGLPDNEWARLLTLLSSLEAVVFAAAGALFGTTVQKQRVEAAEKHAETAEVRARSAEDDAAKGRTLASAIRAQQDPRAELLPAGEGAPRDPLVALADELFPAPRPR